MVGGARRRLELSIRVITLNVNGVRSAASKGLFRWLETQRPDVVCLQELKCHDADLDAKLHGLKAFDSCHAFAKKEGYSGVALYSRRQPDEVRRGFASREFDAEGRYVEARFGNLWIVSVYMPSGSAGPHRQASKLRFLKRFARHLKALREAGAVVEHVFVNFYYDIFPEAKQTLAELNVRLHYLATWWDVLDVVKKDRYLESAQVAEVEKFLHEPAKWSVAHGGVSSLKSGS